MFEVVGGDADPVGDGGAGGVVRGGEDGAEGIDAQPGARLGQQPQEPGDGGEQQGVERAEGKGRGLGFLHGGSLYGPKAGRVASGKRGRRIDCAAAAC